MYYNTFFLSIINLLGHVLVICHIFLAFLKVRICSCKI